MSEWVNGGLQDPAYMAQRIAACEQEIQKGIIGQREIIRQVMLAMLTRSEERRVGKECRL